MRLRSVQPALRLRHALLRLLLGVLGLASGLLPAPLRTLAEARLRTAPLLRRGHRVALLRRHRLQPGHLALQVAQPTLRALALPVELGLG